MWSTITVHAGCTRRVAGGPERGRGINLKSPLLDIHHEKASKGKQKIPMDITVLRSLTPEQIAAIPLSVWSLIVSGSDYPAELKRAKDFVVSCSAGIFAQTEYEYFRSFILKYSDKEYYLICTEFSYVTRYNPCYRCSNDNRQKSAYAISRMLTHEEMIVECPPIASAKFTRDPVIYTKQGYDSGYYYTECTMGAQLTPPLYDAARILNKNLILIKQDIIKVYKEFQAYEVKK